MERLGMPEGEPIEHGLVTRSIESAQRKVEAHNFDIRKQLLEYDNVANDQRREIYHLRNTILESQDVSDQIQSLREGVITDLFRVHVPEESMEEQWDIPGLETVYAAELRLELPLPNGWPPSLAWTTRPCSSAQSKERTRPTAAGWRASRRISCTTSSA